MKHGRIKALFPLLMILTLALMFSCSTDRGKSELVMRLESIFYDPGFASIPASQFSVSDYGAKGDGITLDTRAIQAAIDSASATGGGVVTFPQGVYLSGALFLKSNVELRIDEGVIIRAIQDDQHFPDIWTRVAGIEMYWPAALINIYKQQNVRISGKGTIDGNGKYWWDKFWGDPPRSGGMWTDYNTRGIRWAVDYDCKRVRALVVYDSEDVLLEDFKVLRSGFWTVTMTYCSRVHVNRIVIRNNVGGFGPSSDGINTDSSRDILVENCDIDCNDDNLCIKAGRDADGLRVNRPAENIVYRNSITRAGHGLFTLGSETSGGMRNIEVYGLKAEGTNTGIRFKSARVRGGIIENIWFHDIEMNRVAYPFHFELNWYPSYSYPEIPDQIHPDSIPDHWIAMTTPVTPPEKGIPQFRDLHISRVTAKNAEMAFHVNAFSEKPISQVIWEDVHLEAAEPGFIQHAQEWTMKGVTLQVPGAKRIDLTNCTNVQSPEYISSARGTRDEDRGVDMELLLDTLQTGWNGSGILAIDESSHIITPGDTLYSDTLRVIILPEHKEELAFFEPLGDGFYQTPVNIRFDPQARLLSISGEREHHWIFYLMQERKPRKVLDADDWSFQEGERWMEARKTGSTFRIMIQ